MSSTKTISNAFTVNSIEEIATYEIVWTDINGTTTNIPCDANGVGKVVNASSGANPWITASLYRRLGNNAASLHSAYSVTMHCYDINGNEIRQFGYPSTNYNQSYYTIQTYDYTWGARAKYVAEFKDSSGNVLATSAICRNLDGEKGADGGTAPYYYLYEYAWNNDKDNYPTTTGWSENVPPQGSYAYLWIKTTKYTWNSSTRTYDSGTSSYARMTGEAGTAIATKGDVVVSVVDEVYYTNELPTASNYPINTYYWVRYDQNYKHIYKNVNNSWVAQGYDMVEGNLVLFVSQSTPYEFHASQDGNGYLTALTSATDGDAYTASIDGHLWQWQLEALKWIDLGQFKGEAGKTYYTHIAWATSVNTSVPWSGTIPAGQTSTPNYGYGAITGGSTTPSSDGSKPWMGYLINESSGADTTHWHYYTWSYTRGARGNRGKTGRFYYYGGVFDSSDSTKQFKVNDSTTPYFADDSTKTSFHVFNPTENPPNGVYTMLQMWDDTQTSGTPPTKSFNNYPWEAMNNDFKYLITEAIFSQSAMLGSFAIKDEWMISQEATSDSPSQDYSHFDGDPVNGDFIPVFAVNGETGAIYLQNATIAGNLKTGTFGFLQTSNIGIRTQTYQVGVKGFVLRPDGSATFNLDYSVDQGVSLESNAGATIIGNGRNITLNSTKVTGRPKTFVMINGAMKYILSNIPRSASQATDVGEVYIDSSGYVRVKTS